MAKSEGNKHLGIYISPKEICLSQVKIGKDSKVEPEHLVKFPTEFPVKEGMLRPLSLNHDFFSEKAPWVGPLKQALKSVNWDTSTAVVTLSPQFAILRYFVMPGIDRKFWSKSIPLESKKYIPVSFEEAAFDFSAVPVDGGKKLGVLFGLTQRKSIEFIAETLKAAGITLAAVETTPISLERLFGFIDPQDHNAKGYIHFSGNTTYMLFSHGGYPVLYRESENDSGGTMSERKRLDVKGAMQFVDRYVGGSDYKAVALSGDGVDAWKPVAEKEADPVPVHIWESSAVCGLKDNDAAAFLSIGAALRARAAGPVRLDISGISTAERLEKQLQGYVWYITFFLAGLLLLLTLVSQTRVTVLSSSISSLKSKVINVPELDGMDADAIRAMINKLQTDSQMLESLVSDIDPVAPKLAAIADTIPADLWLKNITYTNPFALSELQSAEKEMHFTGETYMSGETKLRLVSNFTKAVKASEEFKSYSPPFGSIDSTTEESSLDTARGNTSSGARKTSGFTVMCVFKRK
ncbi:MAG: hypothetical protein AUJ51_08820 [Elusimicrobia bacterium CG1_02_56_21]|nr:MAG: hypothetical protein AUJ51_08820 [Elusimicrobia bacterium CG1_02_56_21]